VTPTALRRELGLVAGLGLGGALVFQLVLGLSSYRAPFAFCLLVGLAAAASWRLAAAVRAPDEPGPLDLDPDRATGSHRNGFEILTALEHRLSWSSFDAERFEQRLRPQLVRLAEERLRRQHGVDADRQPDLTRQIVGERLWELMTMPGPTTVAPDRSQLSALLADLERI
jgi:hypothetical protein